MQQSRIVGIKQEKEGGNLQQTQQKPSTNCFRTNCKIGLRRKDFENGIGRDCPKIRDDSEISLDDLRRASQLHPFHTLEHAGV
jgi:hypothetical protein